MKEKNLEYRRVSHLLFRLYSTTLNRLKRPRASMVDWFTTMPLKSTFGKIMQKRSHNVQKSSIYASMPFEFGIMAEKSENTILLSKKLEKDVSKI